MKDIHIKNIGRLVTMNGKGAGLGVIEDAALLIKNGEINWFGKNECAPSPRPLPGGEREIIDAKNGVVMPGLIDCHAHLVHGGYRQNEAALRAKGTTYEEIARKGGGILSTVRATREATASELFDSAYARANEAMKNGITTMEVKSGYGLDIETEIKILKVVKQLNEKHPLTFVPTFLGAHAVPPEYKNNRKKYVDIIINEMIPRVAEEKLAVFADVFVDKIAFSVAEARKIFEVAIDAGLKPKLHADQLSGIGAAELAAEVGAVSADHLEYASAAGIKKMAAKKVSAVMLPGSTFFLGGEKYAPARKLIEAGVNVAISTDYNPGTTPSLNLFLMATIAVSHLRVTYEEALAGITKNAAQALALESGVGTIKVGAPADIILLDAPDEFFPIYRYGGNFIRTVIKTGQVTLQDKSL